MPGKCATRALRGDALKLYTLQCEVFGENDDETLSTLRNLANSYEHLGETDKAAEIRARIENL